MGAEGGAFEGDETIRGFVEGQQVFKRYRLERILGRGGMGVVWLAFDEALERRVALKFVPELVCLDPEAIADLKRETRRSLEITHPDIVRIYDFEQDGKTAAITMEYVDGRTLAALKVERQGCLGVAELRPLLARLCEALDYAHTRAKVVHRDLKPANLMVTADGGLKITDFGISCSISDSVSRVSLARGTSGTPVFMSPQQMMGERPTVADDIYALGATIYDLLSGKPPFYRGDLLAQVREKEAVPMSVRREELGLKGEPIPEQWEAVVRCCLAKDPAARPPSAGDVFALLERGSREPGPQREREATPAAAAVPAPPKKRKRSCLLQLVGAAAAVLAAMIVIPWFIPPKVGPKANPVATVPAPEPQATAAAPPPPVAAPPAPAPVAAAPPKTEATPAPAPVPPQPVAPPMPVVEAPGLQGKASFKGTGWEGDGVELRVRPDGDAPVAKFIPGGTVFDAYPMAGRFWFVRDPGGGAGWAELSEVRLQQAPWAEVAYVARLGPADCRNSKGERLTELRDILRQDRANYHNAPIGDVEDQGEPVFGDKASREWFEDAEVVLVDPSGRGVDGAMVRVDAARSRVLVMVLPE